MRSWSTSTTCRTWCVITSPREAGPRSSARSSSRSCSAAPGTLAANRHWVDGDEMFLACNADNLTDFDLRSLIDEHREHDAIATLTVFHSETPSAGGVVEVDRDGTVVGFAEKPAEPVSDLTNAGMYAFHPSVLDEITGRRRMTSAITCFRGWWAARGPCWWRGTSATSARSTRTGEPGRSGPRGPHDDHQPDTVAHRTARRRDRPAGLLPGARRPRPELRDRQVRLRHRQAAVRRRHLRQLFQEGDRLARR